jgi:hypothetical protein
LEEKATIKERTRQSLHVKRERVGSDVKRKRKKAYLSLFTLTFGTHVIDFTWSISIIHKLLIPTHGTAGELPDATLEYCNE